MQKNVFTFEQINSDHSRFFTSLIISSQNFGLYEHENEGLCLLLITRAKNLRTFPGELCPAGGKLDGNDDAVQTVRRELREEIGHDPVDAKKFSQLVNPMGNFISLYYSKVTKEDLKNLVISRNECASICLLPLNKLRSYQPVDLEIDIIFDEKKHKEEFRGANGFKVDSKILKIKREDLIVLQGHVEGEVANFRPYGYYELERVVLSKLEDKNFIIGQAVLPCYNFIKKVGRV